MERRQHRPRLPGSYSSDPAMERTLAEVFRSLPVGLTCTITIETTAGTHILKFQSGVLVEYTEATA